MDNSKEIKEIKEELASKYTPDFIKVKLRAKLAELESAPAEKKAEPKAKAEPKEKKEQSPAQKEGSKKMTEFANYVKSIRKDGESWRQAMARASRIKKGTEPKEKPKAKKIVRKAKPTPKPKAKKFVRKAKPIAKVVAKKIKKPKRKSDGMTGSSNKAVDKKVKALHPGKRFARKGWKNQFGKSDGKGVYYEKRRDHADANRTKKL